MTPTPEQRAREMAEKCGMRIWSHPIIPISGSSVKEQQRIVGAITDVLLRELNLVELLKDKERLDYFNGNETKKLEDVLYRYDINKIGIRKAIDVEILSPERR